MCNGSQGKALEYYSLKKNAENGLAASCMIYIMASVRTDIVQKMIRSDSSHKAYDFELEHLDIRNICPSFSNQWLQCSFPACSRGTRFDIIILQLSTQPAAVRPG